MPRFDNLEMDPPPDEPGEPALRREVEEHDERYWLRQADANRRQGHYDNALRYYSRALELDKSLIAGWLGQIQMLIGLEEYPEAELWARKALELFRNHGDLLAGRAQAMARLGDASAAHARRIKDASREQAKPRPRASLAKAAASCSSFRSRTSTGIVSTRRCSPTATGWCRWRLRRSTCTTACRAKR